MSSSDDIKRSSLIVGNWKMNGTQDSIKFLLNDICELLSINSQASCVILPPQIYIPTVQSILYDKNVQWGAQNVYPQDFGAYTGEVSGPMLKDFGCSYVLVGHSERRQIFQENEKFIAEKFHHVKVHDMIPILCVGETLFEREQGLTETVITSQLDFLLQSDVNVFEKSIIAYEPVWAIGTGQVASPAEVQQVHAFIRSLVASYNAQIAKRVPILYGGSVNEKNAASLFAMPDVDGGLIGGASLHARQFVEIVKCINCY